jgi:hypothetical protein
MTQPKNPLAILENIFWEIGRLFILYFVTIFALFFKHVAVIDWAVEDGEDKKTIYCPPATFFILSIAFAIAISKFVFYQEAFDAVLSVKIFSNLFLKWQDIQTLILAFGVVAIVFPLNAVLVSILMGRRPTIVRVTTLTRLLLYYWGIFFFVLLVFYIALLYIFKLHFLTATAFIGFGVLAVVLASIFGKSLRQLTGRRLWLSFVVVLITQAVAPTVIGGILAHSKHVHNWTMEHKFEDADIVGVVYVEEKTVFDNPQSFGGFALREVLSVKWEDVWKGESRLDNKNFPAGLISLTTVQRGRTLSVEKDKQYLVFLQIYQGTTIPLNGSPTAIYGISEDEKLFPYGHRNTITERRRLAEDNISLETAKQNLLSGFQTGRSD